jgi:hypothetical protein
MIEPLIGTIALERGHLPIVGKPSRYRDVNFRLKTQSSYSKDLDLRALLDLAKIFTGEPLASHRLNWRLLTPPFSKMARGLPPSSFAN